MSKSSKLFEISALSMGLCLIISGANAATGRTGPTNARAAGGAATARMPSMPTLPLMSVGNISTNIPTGGGTPNLPNNPNPGTPDNPNPGTPDNPNPGTPDNPNPGTPDNPNPGTPTPPSPCADGGIDNSSYDVNACMNDVLRCINNGALPNGLNDLFNQDQRYAIMNGMGLCSSEIDQCIAGVRKNCKNVYRTPTDVWIDFNYRKVQPEYFNFVLRKTGLTPNQAENTCWLIDRNTYGKSFAAVNNDGKTTSEYDNAIMPYNNQQGNVTIKTKPLGEKVNTTGTVDAQRGHYARWDGSTGTCYIRVAAYNKDTPITNKWLFGVAGDDQSAEVWKIAGDTFTCDKDLFGFSLMNKTKTAAVVGVGGGTLLGTGIGAAAGHGSRNFDCDVKEHRELLTQEIRDNQVISVTNDFLTNKINDNKDTMSKNSCREIVQLFDRIKYYEEYLGAKIYPKHDFKCTDPNTNEVLTDTQKCFDSLSDYELKNLVKQHCFLNDSVKLSDWNKCLEEINNHTTPKDAKFKSLKQDNIQNIKDVICDANNLEKQDCVKKEEIKTQLETLDTKIFTAEVREILTEGQKGNRAKTTVAGAAIGAGVGGLATAITAFVEKNNINCRVADGLAQVGLGKTHSIDSLKDIYVKWNLNLPDVITPTATVSDCDSWNRTCATVTDLEECVNAEFNWAPKNASIPKNVKNPCVVSGSTCIPNEEAIRANNACPTQVNPVPPAR